MNIVNLAVAVIIDAVAGDLAGIGPDAAGENRVVEIDAAVDVGDGESLAVDGGIFGDELIEVHLLVVSAPGQKPALFQRLDDRIHNPAFNARITLLRVPHTSSFRAQGSDACAFARALATSRND